nr:retrotransposable element Tf2 [Tanacetum cinerariifolium]
VKWLPLAEFWYNTNFHSAINTTPYEAVYCQTPPIHVPYTSGGDSRVENVDGTLSSREEAINMLKFHMKRAQDKMKSQTNKHTTDREFEEDVESTTFKGGWTTSLQTYGDIREKVGKAQQQASYVCADTLDQQT